MKLKIKKRIVKWSLLTIIFAAILTAYTLSGRGPAVDYSDFAKCLSENDAVMYGTYWCSHCKAQKADFGDSFQHVNYVECSQYPDECTDKGVRGFPTWIIDGIRYEGRQRLSRLAALTGCELPV